MTTNTNTNTAATAVPRFQIRTIVTAGMLGALSMILMMFSIPLPFAPSFYKIDLSELPVLIGAFALGPATGVLIELVKILLHLLIQGTQTMGVGDIANFVIGCCLVLPASLIYKKNRTKKGAVIGLIVGTAVMTVGGCFINAWVLLPAYATAFHMPMDSLVAMGTAVNPSITNITTFAMFAVAPFNIVKGIAVSVLTVLLYKHISPILKGGLNR